MNIENRDMWEKSMKGLESLVKRSTPSSFAYICEKNGGSLTDKVQYCGTLQLLLHPLYMFDDLNICL